MRAPLQQVIERLLAAALAHQCSAAPGRGTEFPAWVRRMPVQDSTILKLPAWLFPAFSGVANAHGTVCNARLQAVYDLVGQRFVDFSLDSYSRNDLAAAPALQLQSGDLVLRDRGYLSAEEIERHVQAGAHCIYRHKTGTTYLAPATLQPIDLPDLLRQEGRLDLRVVLNNPQRTAVRLVAAPVDAATAALRRMKAKKETKGHHPSRDVLALMEWTIFLTTLSAGEADFATLLALYGLRWRIELIFKGWKSHLHFAALHRVSKTQLHILISARLLVITALTNTLYPRCRQQLWQHEQRRLSLLKFLHCLARNPHRLPLVCRLIIPDPPEDHSCSFLLKYCCYDKRKRPNFPEVFDRLLLT